MRPLILAVALAALTTGCGGDHEIIRYVIDAQITAPGAEPQLMDHVPVPHCDNAELSTETLLVYDGWVEDAVAAVQVVYTGIDLSEGGATNSMHFFLAKGDTVEIAGALNETLSLYEVNHRGNMHPIEADKKGGDIEHFYEVIAQPVTEVHHLEAKEKIDFVETVDGWPCIE